VRFSPNGGLTVPKAAYGESHGTVGATDGSWSAPNVSDCGKASDGSHLFGTMELVVGARPGDAVAASRLYIAGGEWTGAGEIDGRAVVAKGLSGDVVSHHDRRMAIAFAGGIGAEDVETLARCCAFIIGIDVEALRLEHVARDGRTMQVRHLRGYRRVGRGAHSPFTGLPDANRMQAWIALVEAFPKLLAQGVPIDMMVDQISAHNQVAQIHVSAPLLLMATLTAAYHCKHGLDVDAGAASRAPEVRMLNEKLQLGLGADDIARFERLRVELLDTGFFHAPGYETGRPQKDIKFIRDVSHAVILRLCGYDGPFYGAENFKTREILKREA
jgi:hypothetical protein